MRKGAQLAIGAGVITAGLAAAGSIYVHDTLIPQQLAQDLNRELTALAPADGQQTSVTAAGDITITRSGLFTYTANVPEMTFAANAADGIVKRTVVAPSTFTLGLDSPLTAAILAAAPQAKVTPSHVLIQNTAPVAFTQIFTLQAAPDQVVEIANIEGACATVTIDAHTDGPATSEEVKLQDCALQGAATNGMTTLAFQGTLNVDYAAKMNAEGIHDDTVKIEGSNLTIMSDAFSGGAIKVENIGVTLSYDGLNAAKLNEVIAGGAISADDLPNTVAASAAIENISFISPQGYAVMPPLSFNGKIEASNLRTDTAAITVHYEHLLDQFAGFNALQPIQQPTRSDCTVAVGNLPVRSVLEVFNAANDTTPPDVDKLDETLNQAGVKLNVDCSAGNELAAYAASVKADHVFDGNGLPGSGTIEMHGVEQVVNQAAVMFGPDAVMMALMALQLAQPLDDGQGAKWDYVIDKNGVLAINGQIVGSTRSMAPRMRP